MPPTGVDGSSSDTDAGHFPASLLYTAARLYYTEEATQAEVAAQLGTSRATVSRLLAEAKRQGIVRIEVVPPDEVAHSELADRLARALSITTVFLSHQMPNPGPGRTVVALTLRRATGGRRRGGLGGSAPKVARWLADVREFFPSSVVQVMQKDAIEKLNLTQLLFEPEMLETVEPDVNLVGTLLTLKGVMPAKAKDAAEQMGITAKRLKALGLVDKVVREPIGGAHRNPRQTATRLKAVLMNAIDELEQLPVDTLLQRRYERLRSYGAYEAA